jgi:hypothetical protein
VKFHYTSASRISSGPMWLTQGLMLALVISSTGPMPMPMGMIIWAVLCTIRRRGGLNRIPDRGGLVDYVEDGRSR